MPNRCRVGDMAVIVESAYPQNLGLIVDVVAASRVPLTDWIVKARGVVMVGDYDQTIQVSPLAACSDAALAPIRPAPMEENAGSRVGVMA